MADRAKMLDANGLVVSNDNDYWQSGQNGEVTEYSLVYVQLLQEMSWLERALGRSDQAAASDQQRDAVAKAINDRLWNADAGASHGPAGRRRSGSRWRWRRAGCWSRCRSAGYGHTIEPLNNGWEMEARFVRGSNASALALMHRLDDQMIDPDNPAHTGALWEFLHTDGASTRGDDSLAHGWSSAPTRLLTEYVLGVRPTGPGYATFTVAPHPSGLGWAEGAVPTPHGPIEAHWNRAADGLKLELEVPEGTTATVALPGRPKTTVGPGTHVLGP